MRRVGTDFRAKILATVSSCLVAMIANAPLLAYHFGQVSVIGLLANLLIAAVVPPILVGSFAAFFLSLVSAPAANLVMQLLIKSWLGWLLLVVRNLADTPVSVIHFPEFNAYWLVPLYGVALLTYRPKVRQP
jgi:competence protein ComEC